MYFVTYPHLHYLKHAIYSIRALTFKQFDSTKTPIYIHLYMSMYIKAINFVPSVAF